MRINILRAIMRVNHIQIHTFMEDSIMAKFRCLECKKEFEADPSAPDRKCPECMSRYLEVVSGEIPRGKSWSAKSYSAR